MRLWLKIRFFFPYVYHRWPMDYATVPNLLGIALCFYGLFWNIVITDQMSNIFINPCLLTWEKRTGNQGWQRHATPVELARKTSHWNQQESTWTVNCLWKEILNSFLTESFFFFFDKVGLRTVKKIDNLNILKAKEKYSNWDMTICYKGTFFTK